MKNITRLFPRFWSKPKSPDPTGPGIGPPDGTFDEPPAAEWRVLESDLFARMYRNDMQLLLNFGVGGAIRSIKGSMTRYNQRYTNSRNKSDRVTYMVADSLLRPIQRELLNVLTLSIQGHFERAFRRWLRNSLPLTQQDAITDQDVIRALWMNPGTAHRDLGELMGKIRGVHLRDTAEGPTLLELALVGNVVRHGDGPSARITYEAYPELFDQVSDFGANPALEGDEDLSIRLKVSEEKLAIYAHAVFRFWHRVQFAYTQER